MKRAAIQIAALAILLLAVCAGSRLASGNTYMASVPVERQAVAPERVRLTVDAPGVVAHGQPRSQNGQLRIPIQPRQQGEATIRLDDGAGNSIGTLRLRVSRFGTVYDPDTGGFTGDSVVMCAFTVFCLTVAAIMLWAYRGARGPAYYSYGTVYAAGFSLFALLTGLMLLRVSLRHLLQPEDYSMLTAYGAITQASWRFMMATAPLLLAFAAAMAVSNIALLRHERFRFRNVLGIGVGVLLAGGEALGGFLYSRPFLAPGWQGRAFDALRNVYATGFVYFECMLLGAVVCGLGAARHTPAADADYILILGCRFRRDGTLTPLLQGRVDRALAFWRQQRDAAGRTAVLMPSGGQGADEVMAEAEAMRRYLLAQGVPASAILAEDQSRNTYQNMAYCKALIDRTRPGARVVYVTTNYHVFRSGVWARLAGLTAEGLGSRTKWWYWPNAFMRECAGLLMNRIPQELALLAALLAFFGALSVALG